jgi:ubiquinone/menaquinone biosynthesis C-methylase UbiE
MPGARRDRTCEGRRVSLPPITEDHRSRRFADGYDRVFAKVERTYLGPIRSRLVGPLTGRIVEIGAGTGANIRHYASAELVELVEPYPRMREQLVRRLEAREGGIPMRAVDGRAEELPFADASVDAVVSTLVLCSVRDLPRALAEVRRVLAPGGVFAYLEHSRGRGLKRVVQTAITPLTIRYAGGCHHDRDLEAAIAGLGAEKVEPVHVPMPPGLRLLPEWPLIAARAQAFGPVDRQ